jgi:plasmid stabilization system protein ParE
VPPVLRTDQAEADLAEILDYLDRRNASAARKLATAIEFRTTHFPFTPRSASRSFASARRICVLTVPVGLLRSLAISW